MIRILLPAFFLFIFSFTSEPLHACEQWQAKMDRVTALKRKGGNAKQMNRWNQQRKEYAENYYECQRAQPKIHTTSKRNGRSQTIKPSQQKLRTSASENPVTRQLLATCNFWIATANHNPTIDNRNFRNTACSAFEQAELTPPVISATPVIQRNVQECIKAGNLLDEEVHTCMTGELEPYWRNE